MGSGPELKKKGRQAWYRSMAGLVDRQRDEWASCWARHLLLVHQGPARQAASPESAGNPEKADDHHACTRGMTLDFPKWGPGHLS